MKCRSSYLRNRAFTLLELLTAMAIGSIIALVLASVLDISIKARSRIEGDDNFLSKKSQVIDVINKDIKASSEIYTIEKTDFPIYQGHGENIGFILRVEEGKNDLYISFYKKGTSLYRYALRSDLDFENIRFSNKNAGINTICQDIYSLDGVYDEETCLVSYSFGLSDKGEKDVQEVKVFKE